MNLIEKAHKNYQRGIYSKQEYLCVLFRVINLDDIETDMKTLLPELLIDFREYVLSLQLPWPEGNARYITFGPGEEADFSGRLIALRNWLQENEDKWIHWV